MKNKLLLSAAVVWLFLSFAYAAGELFTMGKEDTIRPSMVLTNSDYEYTAPVGLDGFNAVFMRARVTVPQTNVNAYMVFQWATVTDAAETNWWSEPVTVTNSISGRELRYDYYTRVMTMIVTNGNSYPERFNRMAPVFRVGIKSSIVTTSKVEIVAQPLGN